MLEETWSVPSNDQWTRDVEWTKTAPISCVMRKHNAIDIACAAGRLDVLQFCEPDDVAYICDDRRLLQKLKILERLEPGTVDYSECTPTLLELAYLHPSHREVMLECDFYKLAVHSHGDPHYVRCWLDCCKNDDVINAYRIMNMYEMIRDEDLRREIVQLGRKASCSYLKLLLSNDITDLSDPNVLLPHLHKIDMIDEDYMPVDVAVALVNLSETRAFKSRYLLKDRIIKILQRYNELTVPVIRTVRLNVSSGREYNRLMRMRYAADVLLPSVLDDDEQIIDVLSLHEIVEFNMDDGRCGSYNLNLNRYAMYCRVNPHNLMDVPMYYVRQMTLIIHDSMSMSVLFSRLSRRPELVEYIAFNNNMLSQFMHHFMQGYRHELLSDYYYVVHPPYSRHMKDVIMNNKVTLSSEHDDDVHYFKYYEKTM